jgi:hypothetical protein
MEVLSHLAAVPLARLAETSRMMRAFATNPELWRVLVLKERGGDFAFTESWHRTFQAAAVKPSPHTAIGSSKSNKTTADPGGEPACTVPVELGMSGGGRDTAHDWTASPKIRPLKQFYSDVLYKPWAMASAPIPAGWTSAETIPRRSGLSHTEVSEVAFQLPPANAPAANG